MLSHQIATIIDRHFIPVLEHLDILADQGIGNGISVGIQMNVFFIVKKPFYGLIYHRKAAQKRERESIRARLRNRVRITPRRYTYPPDHQEEAIKLVPDQAERLSDEWTRD